MSVVIHEVSHGYAANFLGDPTAKLAGRLTLNPLKHLDLVGSFLVPVFLAIVGGFIIGWAKPVPFNPYNLRSGRWGPALVAGAGPLSNIILAVFFGLLLRFGLVGSLFSPATANLVLTIVTINIILALFNLLPVPPLDGSKILFALLPLKFREVEEWMNRYQLFLIIIVLFVVLNTSILLQLVSGLTRLLIGI